MLALSIQIMTLFDRFLPVLPVLSPSKTTIVCPSFGNYEDDPIDFAPLPEIVGLVAFFMAFINRMCDIAAEKD
jgi:hypothetical protein